MTDPTSIADLEARANLDEVARHFLPDLSTRGKWRSTTCPKCSAQKKFLVSGQLGTYTCKGCDLGGKGPLSFLQKVQGMKFPEALKWLADFYKFELRPLQQDAPADGATFNTDYFDQRMAALRYNGKGLFAPHSSGGIQIRFPALRAEDGAWQLHDGQPFTRLRRHPDHCTGSQKYEQTPGSGVHVFIPPQVVDLYRSGQQFPTLFVVEGEFKAYAMAAQGMPIVGITGVHMFYRAKQVKELHPDIMELLRAGKCMAVCFVLDADCKVLQWDPLAQPHKDLGKRLRNFSTAVSGFRMAVGSLVQKVVFSHVRVDHADTAKGLDDLAEKFGAEKVAEDLHSLQSNKLFTVADISDKTWRGINGLFHLNMHSGVPSDFYNRYSAQIGERSFVFLRGRYRFDFDADQPGLVMEEHPDSRLFVRVGCDHFKYIQQRDARGVMVRQLAAWKDTVLVRDYVNKGFRNFLDTIPKFDAFTLVPGHHEDFKPTVETETGVLLNRYKPLTHVPTEGTWPNIEKLLRHLFGDAPVQTIDKAGNVLAETPAWLAYVDYQTIMYRFPEVKLPAVALVSKEKKSGKTKLLEFNYALWQTNATELSNDQLNDNFTNDWVYCLFVGVDETLLDKRHQMEAMKRRITGGRESARAMYRERETTQLIAKWHFCSNNEDDFITLDGDDLRFWIVKVPKVQDIDNKLLEKMEAEIPAYLHHLRTRTIVHPDVDRLWFAESVIKTEAHRLVAANSKGWCESEIDEWLRSQFDTVRWPELYFTVTDIFAAINKDSGARFRRKEVSRVLNIVMKDRAHPVYGDLRQPLPPKRRHSEQKCAEDALRQRWFVFRACDFLPADVADDIMAEARSDWAAHERGPINANPTPMVLQLKHPSLEMESAA